MMIRISEDLEKRLIIRLKQVLSDKKGKITLTHKNGKKDNSRKIWTIYSFLVWYDEYFVLR